MILITGATGKVGGQVLARLSQSGIPTRALVRNPAVRLPVETVVGDLSEPSSLDEALRGIDAVFLVFPTMQADEHAPAVVAKIAEHARHVVYLSAAGVGAEKTDGILGSHARLERLISESSLDWTILRPSGFASNTLGWADQIRATGSVRWFHGAAKRALIHERDIAAVAAKALIEPGHEGVTYHLTGPAQLTQIEQAQAIGKAIGRTVSFVELSPEDAKKELFPGMPGIVDAHGAMVDNPEPVTNTVEKLTGAPATTFQQWAVDHAADFS